MMAGKVALVTGGRSSMAERPLCRSRVKVPASWPPAGRRERAVMQMIRQAGGEGFFCKTDVSKRSRWIG
jgi:hypothetical protein